MNKYSARMPLSFVIAGTMILLSSCMGNRESDPLPGEQQETAAAPVQPPAKATSSAEEREMMFAKELINHQDCVQAFQIFQKYAAEGNDEAEAWLGRCYMNGFGTERDLDKAHEYFEKAAQKNNPWGINGLGVCAQYGLGTNVDLQTAMFFFRKAADMGHPLATLNLARTYADKEGGFFDAKLAEEYFQKAIMLDAPSAKEQYAAFLYDQERYKEIAPLLNGSDEPLAMEIMARCCLNGWGVPVDIAKAVELAERCFRKVGAASWSADLCFEAGLEEWMTNGMTEQAKRCFKDAAEQGHAEAQYLYARILADANDMDGAIDYMTRSADQGFVYAMLEAGKMLELFFLFPSSGRTSLIYHTLTDLILHCVSALDVACIYFSFFHFFLLVYSFIVG